MQVGTYADGRPLNYDEARSAFDVGGTAVSIADVVGYDQAGQVIWLSDELRDWAQGIASGLAAEGQGAGTSPSPADTEAKRGKLFGFRSRRIWKMVLASIYYALCAMVAVGVFASVKPYATSPRDAVLDVVGYLLLVLILLSPAILLSDFGYRQKLPFFKHRKFLWSAVGLVVAWLLIFVTVALADSMHSPPYKVAARREQVALKKKQDAEREAKAEAKRSEDASRAAEAARQAEAKRAAEASKAVEAAAQAEAKRSEDASRAAEAARQAEAKRAADQKAAAQKAAEDAAAQKAAAQAEAKRAAEARVQAALEAVRGTDEYKQLVAGNMTDPQARALIKAARASRIASLGEVLRYNKNKKDGDLFVVKSTDAGAAVKYAVLFKGSGVSEIRDEELHLLYSRGKANKKYIFWEDVGGASALQDYTKEVILGVLKAPSTAEFPGGFLDPLDGWGFDKKPGRVSVSGYVDSQNSFGAMLRSDFAVIYRAHTGAKRGRLTPIYVNLGGRVVYDKR